MILGQPTLVFDIETITDLTAGRHLYRLDLSDEDTEAALTKIRRQETGFDFPQLALHEVVCISGLWVEDQHLKLFSWTQEDYTEKEILQRFVNIFKGQTPILVSWNGAQFDLPVIMQRCLYHGLSAAQLYDHGEWNRQKRFDNYQNRYQLRHTDLMDILSNFTVRNIQKLDDLAEILGLPGKRIVSGYHVFDYVRQQQWTHLSRHCEGDVLNTWLIYLRWLLLRGFVQSHQHQYLVQQTIQYLKHQPQQQEFLKLWQNSAQQTAFTQHDFDAFL